MRDPFAPQTPGGQQVIYQTIVDAGPPLEIPQEKKTHTKLVAMLALAAFASLGVGWACGRIYGARILYNSGIDAATQIKEEVTKMTAVNNKIAEALQKSRQRNQNKVIYDAELLEELKSILRSTPTANPQRAMKQQEQLFRTNYAMMEGIVIDRLFNYYNNSIRLYALIESFVQNADRTKELLEKYSKEMASREQAKYAVAFYEEKEKYYISQLVEYGRIVCTDPEATECPADQITGFMVRTSPTGSWMPKPGKPGGKFRLTDIVLPIVPDENWRRVAIGRPGYLEFKEYVMSYGDLAAVASILFRDGKPLLQDLGKAAGREKVFAPL